MIGKGYWRIAGVLVVVVTAFLVRERAHAQQKVSHDFLVTRVRVFDGARTLQNTQVAVTGGIIRAVGGDLASWRHLPAIDGSGSTLVPGLIDAHAHVADTGDLRQALRFGVTTVLDMGATTQPESVLFAMRSEANLATDIADLRSAGDPAAAPGSHEELGADKPSISTVEEATRFVAMRRAAGADYLKILLAGVRSATRGTPNLDQPRVSALVEAAHAVNMLTVAHVESLDDVGVALSAGVDGLAHVWRRGGADPDTARRLAARGVFVTATLDIPEGRLPEGRVSLLADPRFQSVMTDPIRAHLSRPVPSTTMGAEGPRANVDAQIAAVRGLHEAGVRLLVGTDASSSNSAAHGISVHHEIELFRKAGLSSSEILAAATASTADAFRLGDRGRILPGRRADLLLVRGDPTSDVLAIRDIVRVWKSGVEVDRMVSGR